MDTDYFRRTAHRRQGGRGPSSQGAPVPEAFAPAIFGAFAIQSYLLRDPFLSVNGSLQVTGGSNAAQPGTYDYAPQANPPLYERAGFDGARDCVKFVTASATNLFAPGLPYQVADDVQAICVTSGAATGGTQQLWSMDDSAAGNDNCNTGRTSGVGPGSFIGLSRCVTHSNAQLSVARDSDTAAALYEVDVGQDNSVLCQNGVVNNISGPACGGIETTMNRVLLGSLFGARYADCRMAEWIAVRNYPGGPSAQNAARLRYQNLHCKPLYPHLAAVLP